ncbi:MAG TPA: helix-turn-helix domain-containing protein [Solirubrobacterales bacterium]|nr:helix-turn-helix domain-containing protein [Solirubrobacterales bacterium]
MEAPSVGVPLSASEGERRAWFTLATLADHLQVSERTVRNWVGRGELRSYKISGSRRFDPDDVDAFLARFRDAGDGGR